MVLGGDLNVVHRDIDLWNPIGREGVSGCTPQERRSFNELLSRGFIDTYRHLYPERIQYSFWNQIKNLRPYNKGWRLDYFLLSADYQSKYGLRLVDSCIIDQ